MAAVPPWLAVMQSIDGTHEASGSADNATILGWATYIGQQFEEMASYCAQYNHDSIAWCGLTVAYCMAKSGIKPIFGPTDTDRFLWADAWRKFGTTVSPGKEQPGDVLVFKWASGSHHVTLYEGKSGNNYRCHGGNQSDAVNIQSYNSAYCTGIRRPAVAVVQPQPKPKPKPQPTPLPQLPPVTTLPPLAALAEEAAVLVIRQLIANDSAATQRAAELRAKLLMAREVVNTGLAMLDRVAPVGRPPAPSPGLPGLPLPDWIKPSPAPAPAPAKPAPAPLAHFVGKCSWFGGPNDMGVSPSEGLAFISSYNQAPNLFLSQQPPGTTGLARRLNPEVYYVACRWDYSRTPKSMLANQSVQATVRANGREFLAHPADFGPNENTGRAADLSHGLMTALGISTDDQVEVIYPATQGATQMSMPSSQAIPAASAAVAAPVGSAATSKVNWIGMATAIVPPLVAAFGGKIFGLDSDQLLEVISAITVLTGSLTVAFRTYGTTTILPQSLPQQARNQLGV